MGAQFSSVLSDAGAIYKEVGTMLIHKNRTGLLRPRFSSTKRLVDDILSIIDINNSTKYDLLFINKECYGKECLVHIDQMVFNNNNQQQFEFLGTQGTVFSNGLISLRPLEKDVECWTHGRSCAAKCERQGYCLARFIQTRQFSNRLS